ncbi:MAG: chromosomal replication initiator protein DnaA [Elusimicrobiota bacterium]
MIKKWDLVFSPCDRDKNRYKLLISALQDDLTETIKFFGSDAGKPFTPLSQEYNYAVYIYNVSDDKKLAAEKFLKSKCSEGKIEDTQGGVGLEEIFQKVAGIEEAPIEKPEIPTVPPIQQTPPATPPPLTTPTTSTAETKKGIEDEKKAEGGGETVLVKPKLNLRYIFDEFVVGANNRFVHAAAWAVSQSPGKTYNPLFIYGGVGLGKTHIMQAIGNTVKDRNLSANILYITTEKFTSEVIEAIKDGTLLEFRQQYRNLDLLLVDDIQFLSEAESTQEEFFHTFNILHENQKQIVITSDKPPKKLAGIEDRLKSRFEWGLIADIKPPDLETRVAILKKKAQNEKMELDDKMLIYIASKLKSNIRELEGFLKRLKAYSTMTNLPINMDRAKELIGELLPETEIEEMVEKAVATVTPVSVAPLVAPAPPSPPPPLPAPEKQVVEPVKETKAPAQPVIPVVEKKGGEEVISPLPPAKSEYDLLKPVEVAYFYPAGYEKELEKVKQLFIETIKKHKLKFRLVGVFDRGYEFDKKINYTLFVQLCNTNNIHIAIFLCPPSSSIITEEDFINMVTNACESGNVSAEIIPFADLTKQYKYLNIALDITLLGHKDFTK